MLSQQSGKQFILVAGNVIDSGLLGGAPPLLGGGQ